MDDTIKLRFEQVFIKHYEHLTGTRQAVGGLALSIDNIGCFILFGGRELAIEDVYGDVSERYSLEAFLSDARDAGIDADDHLKLTLEDMIKREYIHARPDGKFYSYQATRDTARMLNRVFPKMQGISLLAYIGQTMEEVASGRIDIETALSRFDQTLKNHGVPIPKAKIPVIAPAPKIDVKEIKTDQQPTNRRIIRDYVVKDAPVKNKSATPAEAATPLPQGSSAISGKEVKKEEKVEKASPAVEQKAQINDEHVDQDIRVESKNTVDSPKIKPTESDSASASNIEEDVPVNDDDIAGRIAAFEKELALVCPICKVNVLTEKKTAAGKIFYTCSSEKCNFISWGKPHHIECARCKNPFLVEITDSTGQLILKCPRATCQYRQSLTPGAVKMVRKRIVRRKV